MISREAITREVLSEIEGQRAQNHLVEKERKEEAGRRNPAISELLSKRQKMFLLGIREAFQKPGEAQRIADTIRQETERINAALRSALLECGLPEDYLQPVYRCALCRDTGYVGEPVHEQCICLKRAVMNRLYQSEGLQGLERENFDAFNADIFSDQPIEGKKNSQRGYILKARDICESYANGFEAGQGRGMLLSGASGLGKTFLMNCIAQRVLERGFSVVVISAYKLMEVMRGYQFSGTGAEQVEDLLKCDLLCIDDLGSEPMLNGITVSAVYHIINERRNANRAIVVTTNCSMKQLYELYTDRVAARLTDQSRMQVIPFYGSDVRKNR